MSQGLSVPSLTVDKISAFYQMNTGTCRVVGGWVLGISTLSESYLIVIF